MAPRKTTSTRDMTILPVTTDLHRHALEPSLSEVRSGNDFGSDVCCRQLRHDLGSFCTGMDFQSPTKLSDSFLHSCDADAQFAAGSDIFLLLRRNALALAGLTLFALQHFAVVPLIQDAETYEAACVIPLLAQSGSDIPLHLETKNYRDFTDTRGYDERFRCKNPIAKHESPTLLPHPV